MKVQNSDSPDNAQVKRMERDDQNLPDISRYHIVIKSCYPSRYHQQHPHQEFSDSGVDGLEGTGVSSDRERIPQG